MAYLLDIRSSLRCWRDWDLCRVLAADRPRTATRVSAYTTRDELLEAIEKAGVPTTADDLPVDMLVPRGSKRARTNAVVSRYASEAAPAGSYRRLAAGVCALSPEACFFAAAFLFPFGRLVEFGCELCGTYGLFGSDFERREREPLTTAARLRSYVDARAGEHGAKLARTAASHVLNGSASPQETRTYLVLCLPRRFGGYGLPKPELNAKVNAKPMAGRLFGKRYYVCDLLWRSVAFGIEYDSYEEHASRVALDRDSKRRAALREFGVDSVTVTHGQLANVSEMERIARAVAKRLGARSRHGRFSLTSERVALHRELFLNPQRY